MVDGFLIADNWTKHCSSGGLQISVNDQSYVVSHSVETSYEDANAWPIPVWVRYESDRPDTCIQWTNRIKILSIRRR